MNFLKNIICFTKKKAIVGIVLALTAMALCGIAGIWRAGIAFGAAIAAVGFIRFKGEKPWIQWPLFILWIAVVSTALWSSSPIVLRTVGIVGIYPKNIMLNVLCMFIVYTAAFVITRRPLVSVTAASVLMLTLVIINGFIFQFRGKEFCYMDIMSIKTAWNVASQYKAELIPEIAYVLASRILILFAGFSLPKLPNFSEKAPRIVGLVCEITMIVMLCTWVGDMPIQTHHAEGSRVNGYFLNFYMGIRDSAVKKPENYEPEAVDAFAEQYQVFDWNVDDSKPNVIVIMNESFVDFDIFSEKPNTGMESLTPFMDSLQEDTIRGHALSSVFGGNTANSEFEFLTGHSLAFLPNNSVPYQQYVNTPLSSLVNEMNMYGYKSIATHPYHASSWCRNIIYPWFGFAESTFLEAYSDAEYLRYYVSDKSMFEYIMKQMEEKEQGKPLFTFGITMQNHGNYYYSGDNFSHEIKLECPNGEYHAAAEQYVNLLPKTDAAMEYLITSLKEFPEDTVVLFFGDHFPSLENEFFEHINGGSFDNLDSKMLQYTVPFMIWANYDIEEKTDVYTSLNYLSVYLLEAAGLELSPYHSFLADAREVIPAINAHGYYSLEKEAFIPISEAEGQEADWIDNYSKVQYNNLFDNKHRNQLFFGINQ